jgi:hypothetical protein
MSTEKADEAEPSEPAESAEPAENAEQAESAEPAENAENAEPAESAEPAETPPTSVDPRAPQPYSNPYFAGVGLGLVLLAAFVVMGRGLGGSSAFATAAGATITTVAPEYSQSNSYLSGFMVGNPFKEWLVFQVLGVFVGGLVSGLLANRVKLTVEHGPRWTWPKRLALAFVGGGIMAVGAKIAMGCTSGQALTGGALLNAGSWVFMLAMFGTAYAVAWFVRKQWI